jgi:hypothetical protein
MSQHSHKYYKFALFGRTNSGKTCYLSALALGNFDTATEMTCVRMPVTANCKITTNETSTDSDFNALIRGEELIEEALRNLNNGYLPKATALGVLINQVLPTIEYKISTPEKSSILVRTVDYPGELIDPAALKSADSAATTLKEIMSEFDGLLIITGVPENKDEESRQTAEILDLKASFAALAESKDKDLDRTPVAIAMTKWDRTAGFNPNAKNTEAGDIENYLTNHPAVDSLFKMIAYAIGNQPSEESGAGITGNYKGNSALFATSAFGNEAPQINGQSYGVLDPLLWLVHRRDFLDTEHLENQWEANKRSKYLPWKSRACERDTNKTLQRMSKRSESYHRLNRVRNEARKKFCISCMLIAFSIVVACDFGTWKWLITELDRISIAIQLPSTGLSELASLEKRLNWVDNSKKFTLFKKRIKTEIAGSRTLIIKSYEKKYYEPFEKAANEGEKFEAAMVYVQKLPNGINVTECKDFIKQHESTTKDRWMIQVENKSIEVFKENDERKVKSFSEEIAGGPPHPQQMTSENVKRLDDLKSKTSDILVLINAKKEWDSFFITFDTAMKSGDYKQTIDLLLNRSPKDNRWNDLAKKVPDLIEKSVSGKVEAALKLNDYEDSLKRISTSVESLKSIELNVRPSDPILADMQLAGQQKIQKIKEVVDQKYDSYLYSLVKNNRNTYACERYKVKSPTKRMIKSVDSYMTYLESLSQERPVTCLVRIKWHQDYDYGDDNKLKILVNNNVCFEPIATIPAKRGEVSDILGSFEVRVKSLNESFNVEASIVEVDSFDYDDNGGKGAKSVKANEMLRTDVSIPLRIENTNIENELLLKLDRESIPQEPELPEYES